MSCIVVIPARYASVRLPGKPLADIAGKPMIARVCERAMESGVGPVIVASDDERVASAAQACGAEAVLTSAAHANGTERVAEVAAVRGLDPATVVVNVQGDEPLLPPSLIEQVAANLSRRENFAIATLCEEIEREDDVFDPDVVKVVFDRKGRAAYFSRAPIPYRRGRLDARAGAAPASGRRGLHHRHIGPVCLPRGLSVPVRVPCAGAERDRGVAGAATRHPSRLLDPRRGRPRAAGTRGGHPGRSRAGEGGLRAVGAIEAGMKLSELPPDMPAPELRPGRIVARYPLNDAGRDFVVGDIHGMFSHLRSLLDDIAFDPAADRLFSVGDLVDRGPQSASALDWLEHAWFHACRGNHEQFALDSVHPGQHELWINCNGGEWWLDLDDASHARFREVFANLPLAMEVETASGVVGIVHADVPPRMEWSRFMKLLKERDRDAALYAMWSRNRIHGSGPRSPVRGGVERVYCGHTPTRTTIRIENVHYIDTGAVYIREGYADARLTVVQIHPDEHREYAVRTASPA